jgi:hypothetical protein
MEEGQAPMVDLLLFIVAGVLLLVAFLTLGLQGPPRTGAEGSAVAAVNQMVSLEGASFVHGARLLDDGDYRVLRSNPDAHLAAARLRKDRRDVALLWISLLLSDLKALWRFRRFVIQRGAPTSLGDEWEILRSFTAALIFLNMLKLSVVILGPFAFSRMVGRAGQFVDLMSRATARSLGRIPSAAWPDIERAWMNTAM